MLDSAVAVFIGAPKTTKTQGRLVMVLRPKTTLGPGVSPRFYFWEYVSKPKKHFNLQ